VLVDVKRRLRVFPPVLMKTKLRKSSAVINNKAEFEFINLIEKICIE
jgi:hypothetical protein